MSQLKKLEPTIRLSIKNPESDSGSVFGRGIADLCLGVRETGSLNAAAKGMGMAYSKAWRIIKETEAALCAHAPPCDMAAQPSPLGALAAREKS